MTTLVWFREDLRLADNPALRAAVEGGGAVVPVYIHSPAEDGAWPPGGASRWWLHHSLERLQGELAQRGSPLVLRAGDTFSALSALAAECGADRIVWNRRYQPAGVERDAALKTALRDAGIAADSFGGSLLFEPWTVRTQSGGPFQVFSAFWRHCLTLEAPAEPTPAPATLPAPTQPPVCATLESFALLPRIDWAGGMREAWTPGSPGAHRSLEHFVAEAFDEYVGMRDQPAAAGTSRLSPHLHFGEIGPREVWHAVRRAALARGQHTSWRSSQFITELGWREFAYHLLYHFPHTPEAPLRANYARFPWRRDEAAAEAWRRGRTGYPIVDAGMRQLWHTGWMHNRVRMIAASFLVKDLLEHWLVGARWFWDTLVDADLASNTLGWQWVAGSGADAAPFFRIFNPVTQGMKFDPHGVYVRRWVPELAALPDEWIHRPFEAPAATLAAADISLGINYPKAIVDHAEARRAALLALAAIKAL